jgi:hypothetical protein
MNRSLLIAAVAGTALPSISLAQKSIGPAPAPHTDARPHLVSQPTMRAPNPDFIRRIQVQNGVITGTSDWQPYLGGSHTDGVPTYVFDAIQDTPGVTPGTQPASNRYLLYFVTPNPPDYTGSYRSHDMAGLLPGGRGGHAKFCDFLFFEGAAAGTPLYVAITTSDNYPSTPTAPDPTWGLFNGIQVFWATGIASGFYFTPIDVTPQAPPVGDGWQMPADGDGAYLIQATRDAAGTMPAQTWQTGLWGTGNNVVGGAVPRVGTQGSTEWTDESTPPNCGAANLTQNVANGILEGNGCENQNFTFGGIPTGVPNPFATAIGFGAVISASSCYANCDGSTAVPFLNIADFVCFQGAFAAGSSYANCDGSTSTPVLNIADFVCFQGQFAAGCSAP